MLYPTFRCSIPQQIDQEKLFFRPYTADIQQNTESTIDWQSIFKVVDITIKHMKKVILSAAFAALIALTNAQAQTADSTQANATAQPTQAAPTGDVTHAIGASGYNASLATAIKTAGLETTLKGAGPFTVFAPSDQAFASVPAGDSLLTQQPKLAAALKNHIISGKYSKDDIIKALRGLQP